MTNRLFRRCNLLLFKICIHQTDQIKQDSNIKETVNKSNNNNNSLIMEFKIFFGLFFLITCMLLLDGE